MPRQAAAADEDSKGHWASVDRQPPPEENAMTVAISTKSPMSSHGATVRTVDCANRPAGRIRVAAWTGAVLLLLRRRPAFCSSPTWASSAGTCC